MKTPTPIATNRDFTNERAKDTRARIRREDENLTMLTLTRRISEKRRAALAARAAATMLTREEVMA